MPGNLMSTREVAAYLGVHEKQVYVLVKRGAIPATRVTGKYVFPRHLVDEWIERQARRTPRDDARARRLETSLMAAGSDDLALRRLQDLLLDEAPETYLFAAATGSRAGLAALAADRADLAFCHLFDPATGEYNVPFVRRDLAGVPAVIVTVFHRQVGLVVAPGNPRRITGVADLARPDVRLANRQRGSGTRLLLDTRLAEAGIPVTKVTGYRRELRTHLEVGLAVLRGEADVGVAEAGVARLLGLEMLPIARERFDVVVRKDTYFARPVQRLLETVAGRRFKDYLRRLGGYGTEESGRIVHASV
ncbi:MAG TPA: helix-turn-helix transcriptional regulator [Thermodesulfobacteriota bacterium]